jgi:hypothetical protein
MQIPNEIILQIASHIPPSQAETLSSLSKTSSIIHSLLSPLLYSELVLTQKSLIYLLNNQSDNFKYVKSITLSHIWSDFYIDHTKSITSLPSTPNNEMVVFPNATTLRLQDTMDTSLSFDPLPIMASLPKLLNVKRLVFDVRHLSWRMRGLATLWDELEVIEMYCRNWTLPFAIPGIHHIIHIQNRSPIKYKPTCPYDQLKYGDGTTEPIPDKNDWEEYGDQSKAELLTMVRWMVHSIQSCAIQEKVTGKGISTWEVRVKNGGKREIEWTEKRVGNMLVMAGLGDGRVVEDVVECFKIVVEE